MSDIISSGNAMHSTCIVVLCGLPGAGKSYFIEYFKRFIAVSQLKKSEDKSELFVFTKDSPSDISESNIPLSDCNTLDEHYCSKSGPVVNHHLPMGYSCSKCQEVSQQLANYHCFYLHYDDLIPSEILLETRFLQSNERYDMSSCNTTVECSADYHFDMCSAASVHPSWKKYRSYIACCLEAWIKLDLATVAHAPIQLKEKFAAIMHGNNANDSDNVHRVFFIDDNMYYKSMRYELFQVARRYYFFLSDGEAVVRIFIFSQTVPWLYYITTGHKT